MTTSSTVMRAFTGMLEVGEESVPATVQFSDGSVSLFVAEDRVGEWPKPEVDFVDAGGAYDIRAEGDSIRFLPDEGPDFGSFVGREESRPADGPPPLPGHAATDVEAVALPADPSRDEFPPAESGGEKAATPALGLQEGEDEGPSPFPGIGTGLFADEPDDEGVRGLLDEDEEEDHDATEQPGISTDAPDELFAAGLSGDASDLPRPRFQSALIRPDDPADPAPRSGETIDEPAQVTSQEQDVIEATPPERLARVHTGPQSEDEPEAEPDGPAPEPEVTYQAPAPATSTPADTADHHRDMGAEEDHEEASSSSMGTKLSRLLRRTAPDGAETQPEPTKEIEDDLPTPISDSDNLKQWMLVSAGGVVLMAIVGVVVWGLISILGGDDQEVVAADQEPVATTLPAPAPTTPATTPPTAPPSTTVPAENLAAAGAFVTSWNDLARDYAYHLTISADSLPISTAPAPTVHLAYGEDGILELTMAPKGTGSDRDILVAMGLAVAWGDPSLSPEGRKQLLGSMGIDVDDPQVSNMGGEVTRNGVDYSTAVEEGVIRFRVTPSA